jgi:hypothetical protein
MTVERVINSRGMEVQLGHELVTLRLKAYMLPRLYWHGMLRGRA